MDDPTSRMFLIPPVLISVFGYLSYQFRITVILRGHLSALEKSMNEKIGKNVHMWNSALVETFMAHNNMINICIILCLPRRFCYHKKERAVNLCCTSSFYRVL